MYIITKYSVGDIVKVRCSDNDKIFYGPIHSITTFGDNSFIYNIIVCGTTLISRDENQIEASYIERALYGDGTFVPDDVPF
jgi:hypothetical protein